MKWFLERMLTWLYAAAHNTLVSAGDPFELPDFASGKPTVVWSESYASLQEWSKVTEDWGLAEICRVCGPEHSGVLAVRAFRDTAGRELLRASWGDLIRGRPLLPGAVWVRLPSVPHLKPYQAPLTWGNLRHCFEEMRLPFDEVMRRALRPARDSQPHICLFGFPIPGEAAGNMVMMHWQACELPPLAHGDTTRAGFRHNSVGYWRQDCYREFRKATRIAWCHSRNWHTSQLTGRGSLGKNMQAATFGIIGAGAVGAVLAELMVRSGLRRLVVIDDDDLEAGNLVRHTLGLEEVGKNKARALAERLRRFSPHASVTAIESRFPPASAEARETLEGCDVLVDCSADDEVAQVLGTPQWRHGMLSVSVSLGFEAKRSYVYVSPPSHFRLADFQSRAATWLKTDADELDAADLPVEAVGCWHPLFPARVDSVWAMVSLAVHEIEGAVEQPPREPFLVVYEKDIAEDGGLAIKRKVVTDAA